MNIRPYGNRVLVEQIDQESVTAMGLAIPESAQGKSQEAIVVAVGEGRWSDYQGRVIPLSVVVGNRVLFTKYSGMETKQEGKTYLLLNDSDILAIL